MWRLLQYKGYRFPERGEGETIPEDALRTEVELEEEDKVVQGAKLQELLRKATPAALEEANDLMKVMAGYVSVFFSNSPVQDQKNVPDYKKMVDDELEKIQNKCLILSGIVEGKTDRFEPDPMLDVFCLLTDSCCRSSS